MASQLTINRLSTGGLITNYTARPDSRHCLYRNSPWWPKEYIGDQAARDNFNVIRSLSCSPSPITRTNSLLKSGSTVYKVSFSSAV